MRLKLMMTKQLTFVSHVTRKPRYPQKGESARRDIVWDKGRNEKPGKEPQGSTFHFPQLRHHKLLWLLFIGTHSKLSSSRLSEASFLKAAVGLVAYLDLVLQNARIWRVYAKDSGRPWPPIIDHRIQTLCKLWAGLMSALLEVSRQGRSTKRPNLAISAECMSNLGLLYCVASCDDASSRLHLFSHATGFPCHVVIGT